MDRMKDSPEQGVQDLPTIRGLAERFDIVDQAATGSQHEVEQFIIGQSLERLTEFYTDAETAERALEAKRQQIMLFRVEIAQALAGFSKRLSDPRNTEAVSYGGTEAMR